MADIIITVPRDQIAHVTDDKATAQSSRWSIGHRPIRTRKGELIGFVWEGHIQAVATISMFRKYMNKMEVHFSTFRYLKIPIPQKSFRNFRYYDLIDVELEEEPEE